MNSQVLYKVGYFMTELNGYIWCQFRDKRLAKDKAERLRANGYQVLTQKKTFIHKDPLSDLVTEA